MPDPAPAVPLGPTPEPKVKAVAASKAAPVIDDATLCEVRKDGERLLVHPTTVAAHVAVGWRVAADE